MGGRHVESSHMSVSREFVPVSLSASQRCLNRSITPSHFRLTSVSPSCRLSGVSIDPTLRLTSVSLQSLPAFSSVSSATGSRECPRAPESARECPDCPRVPVQRRDVVGAVGGAREYPRLPEVACLGSCHCPEVTTAHQTTSRGRSRVLSGACHTAQTTHEVARVILGNLGTLGSLPR